MTEEEKNWLVKKIESIPRGHTRFAELSDGTEVFITKSA